MTTPNYFTPGRAPSWRLTVTVLYLRVRQARTLLKNSVKDFGADSCAALQARAVLAETKSALNAVRLLITHPSSGKWPAV